MKVFIITQQEPFFIYKVIRALLEQNDHEIAGITVLKGKRKDRSRWDYLSQRLRNYTLWENAWVISAYALTALLGRKITGLAKNHGIPVFPTDDVNDPGYIAQLRKLDPDAVCSISPPQIFDNELLNSVKYCFNAHASLLPRHRGVFGTWWTLYHGDEYGGVTVHTMEKKLDAGEILLQEKVRIAKGETQFSLAYKTKHLIPDALIACLNDAEKGHLENLDPQWETSYNYAPTKDEARQYRKKGHRVFKLHDLKGMLVGRF